MKWKLKFAGWLMGLGMGAALAVPCFAQGPRANWAQNRQDNKPPKQEKQKPRQAQRQERRQQQQARGAQNRRQNSGANRPPNSNANRAETAPRQSVNPNRPPSAYSPNKEFNNLSPREKQKVLENNRRLQSLPPAQRQHIRNDVLPKWQQLPPDRKRAIQQRLGVLKNMPESARNQHLSDPNFTRGMSEEDRATLRDLSHLHVGGAPEPPSE